MPRLVHFNASANALSTTHSLPAGSTSHGYVLGSSDALQMSCRVQSKAKVAHERLGGGNHLRNATNVGMFEPMHALLEA